jgi:hypothetical protein
MNPSLEILDGIDEFLSMPVLFSRHGSAQEIEAEIDRMLVYQQALADFLDGRMTPWDFCEIVEAVGIDPTTAESNWINGLSLF